MSMIMTGTFDRFGAMYNITDEEYSFTSDGQAGFLTKGDSSGNIVEKRIYLRPKNGDVYDVSDVSDVENLRVILSVKKKTDIVSAYRLYMHTYSSSVSTTTAAGLFGAIYNLNITQQQLSDGTEMQEVVYEITNSSTISNILKYGIGFTSPDNEYVEISSYSIEADVLSLKTPPVVTLRTDLMTNGYLDADGTYVHMPDKDFTVRYEYYQEKGAEMLYIGVEMIHQGYSGEEDYTGVSSDSAEKYTFDKDMWKWAYVPQTGKIGLRAAANAESAVTYSDIVYLPYKIAYRNILFTNHASGDIIKNNTEFTVAWKTLLPDEFTECPEPAMYKLSFWWDDSTTINSIITTGNTYTFSVEEMTGGSILHLRLQEQYGKSEWDDVKRLTDSCTEISLYVEAVSEILSVRLKYTSNGNIVQPVPTAAWESTEQAAAQVRLGGITFPVQWGTNQEYMIPHIYEDGTYALQVRIQDKYGVWTEWTDPKYYVISNNMPGTSCVTLSASVKNGIVTLYMEDSGTMAMYQWAIYRDGILIAQAPYQKVLEYIDRNANGESVYYVRAMSGGGSYYESNRIVVSATSKTDVLLTEDGGQITLKYTTQFQRVYTYTKGEEVYMSHFAGKGYPVAIRSGKKSRSITREYIDKGGELARTLEDLVGETVLFKDVLGGKIKGILNDVTAGYSRRYATVSFTITAVEWNEGIAYVWE